VWSSGSEALAIAMEVTFRCGDGVRAVAAQDVGSETRELDKGFVHGRKESGCSRRSHRSTVEISQLRMRLIVYDGSSQVRCLK
jgi:hypothetical protein